MKALSKRSQLLILFVFLLTIFPICIYIIGDWQGVGVQFCLFKFQFTNYGNFFITIFNEIQYIILGILGIKTNLSIIFWITGVILFSITILTILIKPNKFKECGLLSIFSSFFFLFSIVTQYGVTFHGPAGTVIPIGLPVLFIIGGMLYYEGSQTDDEIDEEETNSED